MGRKSVKVKQNLMLIAEKIPLNPPFSKGDLMSLTFSKGCWVAMSLRGSKATEAISL